MGRIRWPKVVEVAKPDPCPPHAWVDPEDTENVYIKQFVGVLTYMCEKCFDRWPDPNQVHPTQARPARY